MTRPDFKHRLERFEEKAGAILHRTAVLVGSSVGHLMQKLLEEVDESALNLDTVEARVSCDLCGMSEIFNRLLDVAEDSSRAGFRSGPSRP